MTLPGMLRVEAELSALATVREFVRDSGTALGAPPEAIADLVLAVDEAVTNIIMHGYRNAGGTVEIEVSMENGDLLVRLCDEATDFDPTRVPPPNLSLPLEERSIGGLGVHMMRCCCDRLEHQCRPGGGNVLLLVKHLGPE